MDITKKPVDSLYKLLEQMKAQNEVVKKTLYHHLETELDRTFNQMVTTLVMWAIKNIPDSSTRITDMLSLLEGNEEKEAESTDERPSVNAPQRENVSTIESAALSQEIIQLSDDSIFSSDDEDEICDCKECSKRKKNLQIATEEISFKTETCDESSQFSDVTHISDSQPQLDFDGNVAVKQEASQSDSPSFSAINQLNQTSTLPESKASIYSFEKPLKRVSNKIRIISLKCQNPSCKEILPNREALQSHMQSVHHILPYRCYQRHCTASFTNQSILNDHLCQVHSKQNHFQCALCLKMFKDHSCLVHHSNVYHLEGLIACAFPQCDWSGSLMSKALKHFHQNHVQFTCDFPNCGKTFAYKHVYSLHLKCHSLLRPYQCDWPGCHYASNSCPSTIRHVRKVHLNVLESRRVLRHSGKTCELLDPKDYVKVGKNWGVGAERSMNTKTVSNTTTTTITPSKSVTEPLSPTRKSNRVYQCKWSGCSFSSLSRLKIHEHVNEVHSRHKTAFIV